MGETGSDQIRDKGANQDTLGRTRETEWWQVGWHLLMSAFLGTWWRLQKVHNICKMAHPYLWRAVCLCRQERRMLGGHCVACCHLVQAGIQATSPAQPPSSELPWWGPCCTRIPDDKLVCWFCSSLWFTLRRLLLKAFLANDVGHMWLGWEARKTADTGSTSASAVATALKSGSSPPGLRFSKCGFTSRELVKEISRINTILNLALLSHIVKRDLGWNWPLYVSSRQLLCGYILKTFQRAHCFWDDFLTERFTRHLVDTFIQQLTL